MAKPTYRDATLMLQLAQWQATLNVQEALNWMWSDQFVADFEEFTEKYPWGSEESGRAAKICGVFEMLGTLHKHGLFNEDLLFDWLAVFAIWERIKGYALGVRQLAGNPRFYENFEALAAANVAYDVRLTKRSSAAKRAKK